MNPPESDGLNRTAKLLLDAELARDALDADRLLRSLKLQILVGDDVSADRATHAAVLTLVNAGTRAFHGGVTVSVDPTCTCGVAWGSGRPLGDAIQMWGGAVTTALDPDAATVVIGRPERVPDDAICLRPHGWTASVGTEPGRVGQHEPPNALSAVSSAAIALSELFLQRALGRADAGRREVGISLWQPGTPWREGSPGPRLTHLPSKLWLIGLGHLGQAYAWTLGMLPYSPSLKPRAWLVDYDEVEVDNQATQLLTHADDVGRLKTRTVSDALELAGFETRISERPFDETFKPVVTLGEPRIALFGLDLAAPRRVIDPRQFSLAIDVGLGRGPHNFVDLVMHCFPGVALPHRAFADPPSRHPGTLSTAYRREVERRIEAGQDPAGARCGVIELEGAVAGAAFVGTFAATLAIAEMLRRLHGGGHVDVVSASLAQLEMIHAVPGSPNAVTHVANVPVR